MRGACSSNISRFLADGYGGNRGGCIIHPRNTVCTDGSNDPRQMYLVRKSVNCLNFKSSYFLTNIRPEKRHLRVITNRGYKITTQELDLENFGTAWCNPQLLSNILWLEEPQNRFQLTMYTATEKAIFIHQANGTKMNFVESNFRMFYFETNNNSKTKLYVTN